MLVEERGRIRYDFYFKESLIKTKRKSRGKAMYDVGKRSHA